MQRVSLTKAYVHIRKKTTTNSIDLAPVINKFSPRLGYIFCMKLRMTSPIGNTIRHVI